VDAPCAILVDVTKGRIVAQKNADKRGYPASITKMMTLLVAVENTEDFDSTYEMTFDIVNDTYQQGASRAGFGGGEKVTVTDLLYGCILPSGADATIGLANHLSGSEPAFVKLMNERCKTLGLKNTHFENTSGLHGDKHYSTAADMAVILMAAMQDKTCKEVLSAVKYTTAKTPENPNGLELYSTMFSRMYGTEPEGATIIAGKTGYTAQAGHTMASFATGDNGHEYIFVSMDGTDKWKATYDAINVLTAFCGPKTETSN
jgi:D-alanyl-D-alanine carboxypeptidase (penicillin-binding protein 5/6)